MDGYMEDGYMNRWMNGWRINGWMTGMTNGWLYDR